MIFRRAYVEIISGMEGKESCLTKQMWKWDGSQKGKLSGEEIALKINHFIIRDLEYFFLSWIKLSDKKLPLTRDLVNMIFSQNLKVALTKKLVYQN